MSPDLMPLVDIRVAINQTLEFVQGFDADRFDQDNRTRWAVFSQIVVIGEAARRISREYQAVHPEIPWSEMIGMRNKLAHDYDDIDWQLVWETVRISLPKLMAAIEPLIPKEG